MRWIRVIWFRLSACTERQTGRKAEKKGIRGTRGVMEISVSDTRTETVIMIIDKSGTS